MRSTLNRRHRTTYATQSRTRTITISCHLADTEKPRTTDFSLAMRKAPCEIRLTAWRGLCQNPPSTYGTVRKTAASQEFIYAACMLLGFNLGQHGVDTVALARQVGFLMAPRLINQVLAEHPRLHHVSMMAYKAVIVAGNPWGVGAGLGLCAAVDRLGCLTPPGLHNAMRSAASFGASCTAASLDHSSLPPKGLTSCRKT